MSNGTNKSVLLLLAAVAVAASAGPAVASSGLRANFYQSTCPRATSIVAAGVAKAYKKSSDISAPLLLLHFVDCRVQGCDASLLLDTKGGKNGEKAAVSGILDDAALDLVDDIKRQLESACPGVVSCADVLALAAREAVRLAGGPYIPVRVGRRDSKSSSAAKFKSGFPGATFNASSLIANFAKVGLGVADLVALSGAHTLGKAHCSSVENRLAPNKDPTMNSRLRKDLNQQCGAPDVDADVTVDIDLRTPLKFDNKYFVNIEESKGLLTSDQTLLSDSRTRRYVRQYAQNQDAFFTQFKASMVKMGDIQVLTGSSGEIRRNCHVAN